jgi:hypothetical protein
MLSRYLGVESNVSRRGMYRVYMFLSTELTFVINCFGHSAFTRRIKLERVSSVGF